MKRFLLHALIFCLAVFQIWNIYIFVNPPVKSEMVLYDTIVVDDEYDGIIVRDETVVKSDSSGVLESLAIENNVVKKGKMIASVYSGSQDTQTQAKLKQVSQRIAEITGAQGSSLVFEGDQTKIESNISARISDMIISINSKNIRNVAELKSDLNVLIDKKNEVSGESGSVATMLDELQAQKEQYERVLSASRQNLFAPVAGIYSTLIDGFEEVLNSKVLSSMTVENFKTIQKTEPEITEGADKPVCKIVSNTDWHVAVVMNDEKATALKIGQQVYIKIGSSNNEYNAAVSYISPVENGKCVVGITATEYSEEALKNRKSKITVITEKHTGIKIPIEALRVNNGVQGVYTVTEGLMKFKKADVIYKDKNHAIVKENNYDNSSLLLYDEVVIDAKEVGENIAIR